MVPFASAVLNVFEERQENSPPPVAGAAAPSDAAHPGALLDLGDEITILSANLHAATHRLLVLIAEFDRRRGWEQDGQRSCADWLAFRTGIDLGAAREKVRAAKALEQLPAISAAMARGQLSFAKVRALTRVATPEHEADLLEFARGCTAAQVERLARGWRMLNRHDEAELERIRHRSRTFSVFPGDDGMYVVRGRLDPEVGALLMRAIEAAGDALYRAEASGGAETEPEQRRADAIGLLAERAMAAGFGVTAGSNEPSTEEGASAPASGTRAERYQVVLHVDRATLDRNAEPGRSELEDGTRVSAETSRRLACDASLVRVGQTEQGGVLDVGRKTRTIPPALRRSLDARDRGCRFPGCGLRFTDAHHISHWADGGATRLDNLVLLCRLHHRLVHEEGYRMDLGPTHTANFYDPRGRAIPDGPPPVWLPRRPVEMLVRYNRLQGAEPDAFTCAARWEKERDIPWEVEARAREALDPKG